LFLSRAAFEIASPASGATVCGSFSFTALDGEQDSQYYVQALLRNNETGHESVIVKTTRFDGYEVTAEVDVKKFPKGAYRESFSSLRPSGTQI